MDIAYQSLKRIGYPIFKPKLKTVRGTEHLPKNGGFILAANHVDWLDGFYIATAIGLARDLPIYFLTKSNYYWWTSLAVQIPADRRGDIVETAAKYLRQGKVICNFIEGQRNSAHTLLLGKTGSVRMAIAADVPIIPIGITCTPGRTMAQSLKFLFSKDYAVQIRFGKALRFKNQDPLAPDQSTIRDATAKVMRAIAPLSGKRY